MKTQTKKEFELTQLELTYKLIDWNMVEVVINICFGENIKFEEFIFNLKHNKDENFLKKYQDMITDFPMVEGVLNKITDFPMVERVLNEYNKNRKYL